MAMKYHPDKNAGDEEAVEKFKACREAYEILSDEGKRATYDMYGKDAFKEGGVGGGGGFHDMGSDYFSQLFGGFGVPRSRGPKKTKDIMCELAVTLEDLYNGVNKKVKVARNVVCRHCEGTGSASKKKMTCQSCGGSGYLMLTRQSGYMTLRQQVRCDDCNGEGETIRDKCRSCNGQKIKEEKKIISVEIYKGTPDGKKIVQRGESHEVPGYVTGDLIFMVKELRNKTFQRDGIHLMMEQEIPLANALTGYQFIVTHLDGRKLFVKTGPMDIIKPMDKREIRNEGMPVMSRPYEHGNLYIKFNVKFPTKLDKTQLETLRACLPDFVPAPLLTADMETVTLAEFDEASSKQDSYKGQGNAYDESDEEEGHQGGGVQCAQQ